MLTSQISELASLRVACTVLPLPSPYGSVSTLPGRLREPPQFRLSSSRLPSVECQALIFTLPRKLVSRPAPGYQAILISQLATLPVSVRLWLYLASATLLSRGYTGFTAAGSTRKGKRFPRRRFMPLIPRRNWRLWETYHHCTSMRDRSWLHLCYGHREGPKKFVSCSSL